MIEKNISLAIDEHLYQPCAATSAKIEMLLLSASLPPEVKSLVKALRDNRPRESQMTPNMLGAYLASRLILRRFELAGDSVGCMYALADSVRAMDVASVYRWRYIVSQLPELENMTAAIRLLRQSDRALAMICSLSSNVEDDLRWDHILIPMP